MAAKKAETPKRTTRKRIGRKPKVKFGRAEQSSRNDREESQSICLTNRLIPDRYVGWCERTDSGSPRYLSYSIQPTGLLGLLYFNDLLAVSLSYFEEVHSVRNFIS
jgi:hypothetical protein